MLEILTKEEFCIGDGLRKFPCKNGCILADASQYFRISMDDIVPGLSDFLVSFRYIPIQNIFMVPDCGHPPIISDMIPDIFREIDSSGILTNSDYIKKALNDNLKLKKIENPDSIKFKSSNPTFIEEVKLQYFNMSSRYVEKNHWSVTQDIYSASWRGQNLYIRVKDPNIENSIAIDISDGAIDTSKEGYKNAQTIVLLKDLIKYEYVFRRFIT